MLVLSLLVTLACLCNVNATFKLPFQLKIRNIAASVVAATAFQLPDLSLSPLSPSHIPFAQAAVNPLADVGLKEYLVKDGRKFLRLALPVGKPCLLYF